MNENNKKKVCETPSSLFVCFFFYLKEPEWKKRNTSFSIAFVQYQRVIKKYSFLSFNDETNRQ